MHNFRNFTITSLIALLVGTTVYFFQEAKFAKLNQVTQTPLQKPNIEELVLEKGSFEYDNDLSTYYGNLQIKGYAEIEEMDMPFCEGDCGTFEYAFFKVLETTNPNLNQFLESFKGNSFVKGDAIGLGCIEDSILIRSAHSDAKGVQSYSNTLAESKQILQSTNENPITLDIEKLNSTYGFGTPRCYSHFAKVQILK